MGKNFQNLLRNPFSFMREISISTKLLKYHPEKLMEPKSFLIHFYSQKKEWKCLYIFYRKWSLSWYCHKWFLLSWENLEWQNTAKYRHPFWNVNFCCHLKKTLAMFISYIWQKARDKWCQREFKWENNHIFKGVFFAVSFFP